MPHNNFGKKNPTSGVWIVAIRKSDILDYLNFSIHLKKLRHQVFKGYRSAYEDCPFMCLFSGNEQWNDMNAHRFTLEELQLYNDTASQIR